MTLYSVHKDGQDCETARFGSDVGFTHEGEAFIEIITASASRKILMSPVELAKLLSLTSQAITRAVQA